MNVKWKKYPYQTKSEKPLHGSIAGVGDVFLGTPYEDDLRDYFKDFKLKDPLYLDGLLVKKSMRGRGFGSIFVDAAVKKAGNRSIILQAYPHEVADNDDSSEKDFKKAQKILVKFYERFGFKHVGDGWMYRG